MKTIKAIDNLDKALNYLGGAKESLDIDEIIEFLDVVEISIVMARISLKELEKRINDII